MKNILLFSIGPLISALLGFVSLPLMTWLFTIDDVGRYSLLQALLSLCLLFFSLGLDQAYVRDFYSEENKIKLLKGTMIPCLLLFVFFCLFSSGFLNKYISNAFEVKGHYGDICFLATVFLLILNRFLSLILRMKNQGLLFSISQVIPKLTFIILVIFNELIYGKFNFENIMFFNLVSVFISFLYLIALLFKDVSLIKLFSLKVEYSYYWDKIKYGLPLILGGVCFWGLTAIDRFFIKELSTLNELGLYSVSVSFAAVAMILQNIFSVVWSPIIYKWAESENEWLEKTNRVRECVLLVVLLIFIISSLFSWLITYLIPNDYYQVKYIFMTCLMYPIFYTLSEITGAGINIKKKTSYSMYSSIVAFTVNIIMNYLFVPTFGAAGAAMSTAISFWLFLVLKTEFSCFLGYKIKRIRFYFYTISMVVSSSTISIYGHDLPSMYIYIYMLIFLLFVLIDFKTIISFFVRYVFNKYNSQIVNNI